MWSEPWVQIEIHVYVTRGHASLIHWVHMKLVLHADVDTSHHLCTYMHTLTYGGEIPLLQLGRVKHDQEVSQSRDASRVNEEAIAGPGV